MACGVQKTFPDLGTLTCNNAGTSSHTGLHTASVSFALFGRSWVAVTVSWSALDSRAVRMKPLTVGDGVL